jgi:hypothetical protein
MIGKFMKIRNITTNQIVYVAPEYEQLITVFMTFQQRLSMCDKMIQDGLMTHEDWKRIAKQREYYLTLISDARIFEGITWYYRLWELYED